MELQRETCPLCADQQTIETQNDSSTWLQCDSCSIWYHTDCLNISAADCDTIEIYHCPTCIPLHGPSTCK